VLEKSSIQRGMTMDKDLKEFLKKQEEFNKQVSEKLLVIDHNLLEQRTENIKWRSAIDQQRRKTVMEIIEKIMEMKIMTSSELLKFAPTFIGGSFKQNVKEKSKEYDIHFLTLRCKGSPSLIVYGCDEPSFNFIHLWNRPQRETKYNSIYPKDITREEWERLKQWCRTNRLSHYFKIEAELIIFKPPK
jgi:hypothetical protein